MLSKSRSGIFTIALVMVLSFMLDFIHINFTYFIEGTTPTQISRSTSSPFWLADSDIFDKSARDFIDGKKIDSGLPFRPPIYIILLSLLYKISNYNLLLAKLFGSFLSALVCVFIYLIGSNLFGKRTGIIASLLWACSFGKIILSGSLNNETLYILLSSIIIFYLVKKNLVLNIIDGVIIGFLSGITLLTRAEFQLFIFFILIMVLIKTKEFKIVLLVDGIIFLTALLTISPWMIRNYLSISEINAKHQFGLSRIVPVTAYGSLNFALANNKDANGGFSRKLLESKSPYDTVFTLNNEQHLYYFKNGYLEGFKFLITKPISSLVLIGKKILIFSDALSFGYLTFDFPSGLRGDRRYVDVFVPTDRLSFVFNSVLLCTGLILSVLLRKYNIKFLPVFAIMICCIISNILFFGYVRLGLTILPYLLIFIAYPLAYLANILQEKISLTLIQKVVILFILVIILTSISYSVINNSKTLKTEDIEAGKITRIYFDADM
jgi:4-amino-4-deoxy-L-arabinose transferase-like glycosyltransferase